MSYCAIGLVPDKVG